MHSVPLHFRRVPVETGAELVSWPPLVHSAYHDGKWPFSIMIRFTLQTLPFEHDPVVHCDVGVRRWAGEQVYLPWGQETSAYVLADSPFLMGATLPRSFQVIPIGWDKKAGGPRWSSSLAQLLDRLSVSSMLPSPKELCADPASYIDPQRGHRVAIVYRNAMRSKHGVAAGLMPGDRHELLEQIASVLAPYLELSEELERVSYSMGRRASASANEDEEEAASQEPTGKEALRSLCGVSPTVDLLYQTDKVRDAVIQSIAKDLRVTQEIDLGDVGTTGVWGAGHEGLYVRYAPLGSAGDRLALDIGIKDRVDRLHQAIEVRCDELRAKLSTGLGAAAIIEVAGKDAFEYDGDADPKFALRIGAARLGRVSQFVVLPETDEDPARFTNRVDNTWKDIKRQLGFQASPPDYRHIIPGLPPVVNYVAVWLIKQERSTSCTKMTQYLPVLVHMASNTTRVQAIAPGFKEWLPYPEALKALACSAPFEGRKSSASVEAIHFIQQIIEEDVSGLGEVLLLTCAQNLRYKWHWLTNTDLKMDEIRFADNQPALPITTYPGLRHVRVRTSDGSETPEYYGQNGDSHGLPKGLWTMGTSGRVFASTQGKPGTMKNLSVNLSKLAPWTSALGRSQKAKPGKYAWNPSLVELTVSAIQPGDRPSDWAALTHELRSAASHYNEATVYALPLHLAKLMAEYALPLMGNGGNGQENE
ncbi:MAG: RNaseH domain-containing protein [Chloroflexota bacterium]